MRTHNNSRLPSFVLIGLLIAIALLAYSYWSVSLKNSDLVKNMEEQSDDLKRERLKKRELNQRLEAMDQKLKEYMADFEKEKTQTKNFEKAWNSCRAELSDAQHEYELAKSDASVCQNKMTEENDNFGRLKSEKDDLQSSIDKCRKELDDEKSGRDGDNQQASNSCDRKVDDYRLMVLQKIKEVAGDSVILSLQRLGVDISGFTLDKTAQYPSDPSTATQRVKPKKALDISALGEMANKNSQYRHGQDNNGGANNVNNVNDNTDKNNGQSVNDKPVPAAVDVGHQNTQFQNNAGRVQQDVNHRPSNNNNNDRSSNYQNVPSVNDQPPKATPPVDQQLQITPGSPRGAYRKPVTGDDPYASNVESRVAIQQQPSVFKAIAPSANQIMASPSAAVSASQKERKERLLQNAERYKLSVDPEMRGNMRVGAAGSGNNLGVGAGAGEEINVGDVQSLHQQRPPPLPAQVDQPIPAATGQSDAKQGAAAAPVGAQGDDRSALGQHVEPLAGQPSDTKVDKVQTVNEEDKTRVDDRDAELAAEDQGDNDAGKEDGANTDNRHKDEEEDDEDTLRVKASAEQSQDKAAAAADGADEREAGNKGDGGTKDDDEYDEDIKGRPAARQ